MMHMQDALEINGQMQYSRPTMALAERVARLNNGLCKHLGLPIDGDDVMRMSGFELLELVYESEKVRLVPGTLGDLPASGRSTGASPAVLGLCGMNPMAVHTAGQLSHALNHALVRCL